MYHWKRLKLTLNTFWGSLLKIGTMYLFRSTSDMFFAICFDTKTFVLSVILPIVFKFNCLWMRMPGDTCRAEDPYNVDASSSSSLQFLFLLFVCCVHLVYFVSSKIVKLQCTAALMYVRVKNNVYLFVIRCELLRFFIVMKTYDYIKLSC